MQTAIRTSEELKGLMLLSPEDPHAIPVNADFVFDKVTASYQYTNSFGETYHVSSLGLGQHDTFQGMFLFNELQRLEERQKQEVILLLKERQKQEARHQDSLLAKMLGTIPPTGRGTKEPTGELCSYEIKGGPHAGKLCGRPLIIGERKYCDVCQERVKRS